MKTSFRAALAGIVFLPTCLMLTLPLYAQQPGPAASSLSSEAPAGSFVHAVYFWLRPDLSMGQRDSFVRGLQSLRDIEIVQHGWVGVPAATDRPIIERRYSYALTLVFVDADGQDAYQVHPIHDRFREEFGDFWTQVLIYDSVEVAGEPD